MVYTSAMRCIQLYIEDDISDALTAAAARRGTSRSALAREAARAWMETSLAVPRDAADDLVGCLDIESDGDIDSVVYELGHQPEQAPIGRAADDGTDSAACGLDS